MQPNEPQRRRSGGRGEGNGILRVDYRGTLPTRNQTRHSLAELTQYLASIIVKSINFQTQGFPVPPLHLLLNLSLLAMSDDSHFSIHPVYRSRAAIPAIVVMAFSPDGQRLAFGDVVGRLVIMRDILGSCVRDFDSLLTAEQPITSLSWLAPFVQCGAIHTPQVLRPADLIVGDEQGFIHVVSLSGNKAQ